VRLNLQAVVNIQYYIFIDFKSLFFNNKNKTFIIENLILEIDINSVFDYLTIYINCKYKNNNPKKLISFFF